MGNMGNIGVVTEGTTLLIRLAVVKKELHMPRFCKYKYLHVKIACLAVVKSCVTVGHFCVWQIFRLMHLPLISSQL